jgi:two-component sensor histidine kinase
VAEGGIGFGFKEVPLGRSLCPGIELEPGLTIIPDLSKDERSSRNPLVVGEPQARFYAGVRLETSEGVPLGTLCVLDDDVRDLDDHQRFALVTLARQVMTLLELRRALRQRDEAISGRKEAERGKFLLTRELHHRVKNTLAVVQAVASSSGRSATNVTEFQSALTGRIAALAKTHAVISDAPQQAASLPNLLASELAGYQTRDDRITLTGPEVEIPSETAIPLGLAIHELTANSAKFGALSVPEGGLSVSWQSTRRESSDLLTLRWVEHGGPRVEAPAKKGSALECSAAFSRPSLAHKSRPTSTRTGSGSSSTCRSSQQPTYPLGLARLPAAYLCVGMHSRAALSVP